MERRERLVEIIWLERGYRALLDAILNEDPDWLAVQVEASRRLRADEGFRAQFEKLEQRAAERREERCVRLAGQVRGLAFARVSGDELPDLDLLNDLVGTGVAPR